MIEEGRAEPSWPNRARKKRKDDINRLLELAAITRCLRRARTTLRRRPMACGRLVSVGTPLVRTPTARTWSLAPVTPYARSRLHGILQHNVGLLAVTGDSRSCAHTTYPVRSPERPPSQTCVDSLVPPKRTAASLGLGARPYHRRQCLHLHLRRPRLPFPHHPGQRLHLPLRRPRLPSPRHPIPRLHPLLHRLLHKATSIPTVDAATALLGCTRRRQCHQPAGGGLCQPCRRERYAAQPDVRKPGAVLIDNSVLLSAGVGGASVWAPPTPYTNNSFVFEFAARRAPPMGYWRRLHANAPPMAPDEPPDAPAPIPPAIPPRMPPPAEPQRLQILHRLVLLRHRRHFHPLPCRRSRRLTRRILAPIYSLVNLAVPTHNAEMVYGGDTEPAEVCSKRAQYFIDESAWASWAMGQVWAPPAPFTNETYIYELCGSSCTIAGHFAGSCAPGLPPSTPSPPALPDPRPYKLSVRFRASGAVEDFDVETRDLILSALSGAAGVTPTPEGASLTVSPASVMIVAVIPFATAETRQSAFASLANAASTATALSALFAAAGVSVVVESLPSITQNEVSPGGDGGARTQSTSAANWRLWVALRATRRAHQTPTSKRSRRPAPL